VQLAEKFRADLHSALRLARAAVLQAPNHQSDPRRSPQNEHHASAAAQRVAMDNVFWIFRLGAFGEPDCFAASDGCFGAPRLKRFERSFPVFVAVARLGHVLRGIQISF